jgi:hypothetical protein
MSVSNRQRDKQREQPERERERETERDRERERESKLITYVIIFKKNQKFKTLTLVVFQWD